MFGSIFSVVIYSQPDFYLAAHLTKSFNDYTFMGIHFYGQRMLSFMLVINTILIVLVMNYINRFTNRWALRRSFAFGTFLQGFGFAISFLLHDFWPLIIVTVVFTLGEIINVPSSQTMRADMMNPAKIGAYSGAFAATRPVGNIVAGSMVSLSQFTNDLGMAGALMIGTFIAIVTIMKASKMPARFDN
jgi:DHA1 family multidrug resistance protein B-like MFS transporter